MDRQSRHVAPNVWTPRQIDLTGSGVDANERDGWLVDLVGQSRGDINIDRELAPDVEPLPVVGQGTYTFVYDRVAHRRQRVDLDRDVKSGDLARCKVATKHAEPGEPADQVSIGISLRVSAEGGPEPAAEESDWFLINLGELDGAYPQRREVRLTGCSSRHELTVEGDLVLVGRLGETQTSVQRRTRRPRCSSTGIAHGPLDRSSEKRQAFTGQQGVPRAVRRKRNTARHCRVRRVDEWPAKLVARFKRNEGSANRS